jgi:hypothetical protein
MVLETVTATMRHAKVSQMSVTENESAVKARISGVVTVDDCLDVIVAWAESRFGKNFFVGPLEEFQSRYGKVNHEDDFYQTRMNYFLEWCVLERPMGAAAGMSTPAAAFFREYHELIAKCGVKASDIWQSFAAFRHGMFQIIDSAHEVIEVLDLCFGGTFKIVPKSGETMRYLARNMIFQGYVFGLYDQRNLGQGMIIHPELAAQQINKFFKQHLRLPRLASADICRIMAATNMRYLRMQHVNPAVIYQTISG